MRRIASHMADQASRFSFRALEDLPDLQTASDLVTSVWGESLAPVGLLRAYTRYGNPVIGAFDDDQMCGVSIGFLALDGGLHLHSHVTGVAPTHQHLGIGFALKAAQRDWCLAHGIDHVTWTFDPLLARNAYFNIRKLGAVSSTLLRDFYGPMNDEMNRGDTTDRLEVEWPIATTRVEMALDAARDHADTVPPPAVHTVAVPSDYLVLRASNPDRASRRRIDVCDDLAAAFAEGLTVVDFSRDAGYHLAEYTGS